jgi:hypothetical protein
VVVKIEESASIALELLVDMFSGRAEY